MKSNLITQLIVVVGSALAMFGMSLVGRSQAQKKHYNPSIMPTLNLVAAAFLLSMLISNQFEKTSNNFSWITGIIVLIILLVCNYLSPEAKSSIHLTIKHNSNIQNLKTDWTQNIQKLNVDTLELFWGPDIAYQQKMIQQITQSLDQGTINIKGRVISFNVDYDRSLDQADQANQLRITKFIEQVLGPQYGVQAKFNSTGGISFGLAVAVLINFVMDGLLAGNEIKYSGPSSGLFNVGYMKLNNIFGFIFDNLILMLILGFQFAQSALSHSKQMIYLGLIVLSFVIAMFLGMFTSISTSINKGIANTIVFIIIAYTVLIELLPESASFKDYYGRTIETNNPEDPYLLTHNSKYIKNYSKAFMPLILFVVYFGYKKLTDSLG